MTFNVLEIPEKSALELAEMADEARRLAARQLKNGRSPIGMFLAQYRLKKGMTLKDMAVIIGITPSYLSAIEHGTRPLTGQMAEKMRIHLAIPTRQAKRFDRLCDLSSKTFALEPAADDSLDMRLCHEFVRRYRSLDSRQKRQILAILDKAGE